MPFPAVCSRRAFRSFRSCPEMMMAGPGSTPRETVVGSGVPKVSVLARSSISMQVRLADPTAMTSGRSSSMPPSEPTARRPL